MVPQPLSASVVGCDLVEVAPAYDATNNTAHAGAQMLFVAFGALVLAWVNRTLSWDVLRQVIHRTSLTVAMIFFIFVGATAFSTVFRNVYGEDLIIEFIEFLELGPWPLLFLLMFIGVPIAASLGLAGSITIMLFSPDSVRSLAWSTSHTSHVPTTGAAAVPPSPCSPFDSRPRELT